jgi:nucleoid DNA-binding protein
MSDRIVKVNIKERGEGERPRSKWFGKETIQVGELSKLVARRAGVTIEDTRNVLRALPSVIIELIIQGFFVNIDRLGTFYLRELNMPTYSYKEKKGTGYQKRYSFSFHKPKDISKYINTEIKKRRGEENVAEE